MALQFLPLDVGPNTSDFVKKNIARMKNSYLALQSFFPSSKILFFDTRDVEGLTTKNSYTVSDNRYRHFLITKSTYNFDGCRAQELAIFFKMLIYHVNMLVVTSFKCISM